jgi:hypothetical protein
MDEAIRPERKHAVVYFGDAGQITIGYGTGVPVPRPWAGLIDVEVEEGRVSCSFGLTPWEDEEFVAALRKAAAESEGGPG